MGGAWLEACVTSGRGEGAACLPPAVGLAGVGLPGPLTALLGMLTATNSIILLFSVQGAATGNLYYLERVVGRGCACLKAK